MLDYYYDEPRAMLERPMRLYLIAGEASGDRRGQELMAALRERNPGIEFMGAGGPRMQAIEPRIHDWSGEAVVGLWDVLKKYGYFRAQFARMLAEIRQARPDAVIFIDYPGFNLRMARALRDAGDCPRIIYYISPQVWAWHRGRIAGMAQTVDLMICIFPFEKALYEKSGLRTVFAGHPLIDTLATEKQDIAREPDLAGLFPGSRRKEVERNFPVMIEAAKRLACARPHTRFAAAAASDALAGRMREILRRNGWSETECEIGVQNSHDLMQRAGAGIVASGTATVEAAYFRLPFAIIYRVAWLTWAVGKRLAKVQFLGMVNILGGREIVREFLQSDATPEGLAGEMSRLLDQPAARDEMLRELDSVIAQLGEPGASGRAAEAVLAELQR